MVRFFRTIEESRQLLLDIERFAYEISAFPTVNHKLPSRICVIKKKEKNSYVAPILRII